MQVTDPFDNLVINTLAGNDTVNSGGLVPNTILLTVT